MHHQRVRDPRAHVDNVVKIHSLDPESLRAYSDFYRLVMHAPSELIRAQREMVAVARLSGPTARCWTMPTS